MVFIIGMQGESVAAEVGMTLQQPEAHLVFSRGSCPWILGPWHGVLHRLPGPGCGLGIDLCLHTGFLVAVAAA